MRLHRVPATRPRLGIANRVMPLSAGQSDHRSPWLGGARTRQPFVLGLRPAGLHMCPRVPSALDRCGDRGWHLGIATATSALSGPEATLLAVGGTVVRRFGSPIGSPPSGQLATGFPCSPRDTVCSLAIVAFDDGVKVAMPSTPVISPCADRSPKGQAPFSEITPGAGEIHKHQLQVVIVPAAPAMYHRRHREM